MKDLEAHYPSNLIQKINKTRLSDMDPLYLPLSEEQKKGFEYALGQLTERQRKAIKMKYEEGKTLKEIGEVINASKLRTRDILKKSIYKLCYRKNYTAILYGPDALLEYKYKY